MFKKLLVVSLVACMALFAGNAFADQQNATGDLGTGVFAIGGGLDASGYYSNWKNMGSFGISGAGGLAGAGTLGYISNGEVSGFSGVSAGGLTQSTTETLNNSDLGFLGADKAIGVRSFSDSEAQVTGSVMVSVDPAGHYALDSFGFAAGGMAGIAGQGTLDASYVGSSPLNKWKSDGKSFGIAGQGSIGGFVGYVHAESAGDIAYDKTSYTGGEDGGPGYYAMYKCHPWGCWAGSSKEVKYFPNGHPEQESEWEFLGAEEITEHIILVDSNAGASIDAGFITGGRSDSASYRWIKDDGLYHTEGMRTEVFADTFVSSWMGSDSYANGSFFCIPLSNSDAYVTGGYKATGGAFTMTNQSAPNNTGGAVAIASGKYSGSSQLGTNYYGSASGFSGTTVTTKEGYVGSINSSSAGMTVISTMHNNN